jgi:hypothetical protein
VRTLSHPAFPQGPLVSVVKATFTA